MLLKQGDKGIVGARIINLIHNAPTSMMNMQARNQYLYALIGQKRGYHLGSKKKKTKILDEYCRVTGQNRIAVSRKIRTGAYIRTMRQETGEVRRTRSSPYDGQIVAYLIKLWEIFDRPCGQRLSPMIRSELDRLRRWGEIMISDEMADKLKTVSSRTIDAKLKNIRRKSD